jgi:hypothetical protein
MKEGELGCILKVVKEVSLIVHLLRAEARAGKRQGVSRKILYLPLSLIFIHSIIHLVQKY